MNVECISAISFMRGCKDAERRESRKEGERERERERERDRVQI